MSDRTCRVEGQPGLELVDGAGRPEPVAVTSDDLSYLYALWLDQPTIVLDPNSPLTADTWIQAETATAPDGGGQLNPCPWPYDPPAAANLVLPGGTEMVPIADQPTAGNRPMGQLRACRETIRISPLVASDADD